MSNRAKLVITFNQDAVENDWISFYRLKQPGSIAVVIINPTWKNTRTNWNEIPVGVSQTGQITGTATALAFRLFFNLDYNQAGLMDIQVQDNVVVISIDEGWTFGNWSSSFGVTFEYYPPTTSSFQITDVKFLESTTPCETVIVEVTTTEPANSVSVLVSGRGRSLNVSGTTFSFSIPRTTPTNIVIKKSGKPDLHVEEWFDEPHIYIRKLTLEGLRVDVHSIPLIGSTAQANVDYGNQLTERPEGASGDLMYRLDSGVYDSRNFFNGLIDGDYSISVKDELGCSVTRQFTIDGVKTNREKYFFVSDLNSIGVSENQRWNGVQNGIDKNPENTLSTSSNHSNLYEERIIYREDDAVRIQFKSNYDINEAKIEGCSSSWGFIPSIEKMSKNLNIKERLDAKMVSYGDGSQTAIYYDEGVIYDEYEINIGNYELNGNLPDSASIGNYFQIIPQGTGEGGVFPVSDIFYDSEMGKFLVIFNYDCEASYPVDVITNVLYDLLNYEVYEFTIPFNSVISEWDLENSPNRFLNENLFRLELKCSDSIYDERQFYSEWIEVVRNKEEYDLDKYLNINYWNKNDRSIFYLYGITHFIRVEFESIHTLIDDSVEIVKGDASSYLTESVLNHGIEIKFADTTYKMLMRTVLAMSSEVLFINGLGYVKMGSVELEPVEGTNLHSLTVRLLRNSQNFNTFAGGRTGRDEGYNTVYIPQLITTNLGGSIKI